MREDDLLDRHVDRIEVRDVDVIEEPELEDDLYPNEFDELDGEIV